MVVTRLAPGTLYFVQSYATNSEGTGTSDREPLYTESYVVSTDYPNEMDAGMVIDDEQSIDQVNVRG
jgi:hypothetical protein